MKRSRFPGSLRLALFAAAGIGAAALGMQAMDWPTEGGLAVSNFGLNRQGRPLLGSVFETRDAVRAVEDGTVLFVHDPASGAARLPSPLGYWAAVDHGDGLVSIYGRLSRDRPVPVEERLSGGQAIAAAGSPGTGARTDSPGRFWFSFYDRKERRWINPSVIITPQEDTVLPQIIQVELRNGAGQSWNLAQARRLAQGTWSVLVTVQDAQTPGRPAALAPHLIICTVNGMETSSLSFETFSARDGVLMAARNGLAPVRGVYAPVPGWDLGSITLTRGQAALEIIVQDAAGNTRNAQYRLQVE